MAHTDPIADLLTRIRNANRAGHPSVLVGYSRVKEQVARVILEEGFLSDVQVVGEGTKKALVIELKYTADRRPVLTDLQRISKPGRRIYRGYEVLQPVRRGLGIAVLSTPKGVMTEAVARQHKVGGEVMCAVW